MHQPTSYKITSVLLLIAMRVGGEKTIKSLSGPGQVYSNKV
jgi:hypothetical protein